MIMKSNLGKMLRRMPQQSAGMAATPSDMIMRSRQMMGGRGVIDNRIDGGNFGRPMQPPMAYPGGDPNFNESTGVYTPDTRGLGGSMGGMLSRFAQQLRNAETKPNTRPGILGGMQPRQLTPEEAMAITSMPRVSQPYQEDIVVNRPMGPAEDTVGVNAEAGIPLWMQLGLPNPAQAYQEDIVVPNRPMGPLSAPQDPGFNINTATNTFFKSLGDRVASGQMTLDQARAAQAEMRALQLNPAMANRAAATEIAQRNLQVGPYAPRPAQDVGMPMQGVRMPEVPQYMPSPPPVRSDMLAPQGLTLSNVPQQGVAPQPMSAPQGMALGGLMRKYGGMC